MQITQKFLEEECRKMEKLLSAVKVKAEIVGNDDDIYIALTDLQGAPVNGIETAHFHYAKEVIDALNTYFEGIYLNGYICCNADHDFHDFKEAEECARKAVYYNAEADNIKTLLEILEEERSWLVFSDGGSRYILPRQEAEAAHQRIEFLNRRSDMEDALHRLVHGETPAEELSKRELSIASHDFEEEYGISAEDAFWLADIATKNFFDNFTVDEAEYDQMDFPGRVYLEN